MRRLPVAMLAVLMTFSSAVMVRAADDPLCSRQALLSLVDTALAGQPSLPKLASRRYGARAAFLKIRYGQFTPDTAADLMDSLVERNVHGAEEMRLTWSIHTAGDRRALLRLTEGRPGPLSLQLPVSAVRALLLKENGPDILLDRIAATPTNQLGGIAQAIMTAVIDQPDALKETIALAAEKRNVPLLSDFIAAHLVATMKNPDAFTAFLARRPRGETLDDLIRVVSSVPAFVGNPRLKRSGETPEVAASRTAIHSTLSAAALEPELDFLNTYLNQTGEFRSAAKAADAIKEAVERGTVQRDGTLDVAWLIAYRALVEAAGDRPRLHDLLASITIQVGRYAWSGRVTIRDVIDHLLVVEALKPYVRGESQIQPEPPEDLSETMKSQFSAWLAMAQIVRLGTVPTGLSNDPGLLGMVSELLFAKGDVAQLAAFVKAAPASEASVFTATDFSVRLDRHCASNLWHPAEAVLLSGQPIFKFDTGN